MTKMTQKEIKRNNGIQNNNATQETLAWCRGYAIAQINGYEEIRDCRIFAMAYAQGFLNGKKAAAKKQKRVSDNIW